MIPQSQPQAPGEPAPQALSQSLAIEGDAALRGGGQTMVRLLSYAIVSGVVAMVAIGIYDVAVRQPRTPRLAVVDVARLYELAHEKASRNALMAVDAIQAPGTSASAPSTAALAGEALSQFYRMPEEFGPALSNTMKELSKECRCTLVAMSTVFGADSTIPDYTEVVATLLGLAQARTTQAGDGGRR
ncbi:hypothetical protein [Ideonella sp. YS5]|uniref:hypothetical protein n=1 Tax=Ideonella sp. YS5 TaxID=3453714 RepID=UPI003EE95447